MVFMDSGAHIHTAFYVFASTVINQEDDLHSVLNKYTKC